MSERTVTGDQMKAIDRYTIEKIGIPSLVLMERAALGVAEYVMGAVPASKPVLAVCGTGNNGADGIAVGRILFLKKRQVDILLIGNEEEASEETKQQLKIARNIGLTVYRSVAEVEWSKYSVIVDAVFGIGLSRKVEGEQRKAIEHINQAEVPFVVSVDIPSGLSGNTGKVMGVAVQATATVTFGWEKTGMQSEAAKKVLGEVIVTDIGYPEFVFDQFKKG